MKKYIIGIIIFISSFVIMNNVKADTYFDLSSYYSKSLPIDINAWGSSYAYQITFEDIEIIEEFMKRRGNTYFIVFKLSSGVINGINIYEYYNSIPTYLYYDGSSTSNSFNFYVPNDSSSGNNVFTFPTVSNSKTRTQFDNVLNQMKNDTYVPSFYGSSIMPVATYNAFLYSTNAKLIYKQMHSYDKPIKINDDKIINFNDEIITYKDLHFSIPDYEIRDIFYLNNNDNEIINNNIDLYFKENNNQNSLFKDGKSYFKVEFITKDNSPITDININNYEFLGNNEYSHDNSYVSVTADGYTMSDISTKIDNDRLILTGQINVMPFTCAYSDFLLRFNFTTTQDLVIATYDTLEQSNWKLPKEDLSDYIYYEFPKYVNTAYISGKKNNNFRIYTLSDYNKNLFRVYNYNYIDNRLIDEINPIMNINDYNSNFMYYNVSFNYNENQIISITRNINFDNEENETVSFWLPKEYSVSFPPPLEYTCGYEPGDSINCVWHWTSTSNSGITIVTPGDDYTIGPNEINNNINNITNEYIEETQNFTNIGSLFSQIKEFINSIKYYISTYTELASYFFNNLNDTIKMSITTLFIVIIICTVIITIRK